MEGLFREVHLLVQSCRNRPAEFARSPRCPPGACQRRLLPLPVLVMLIFKCFLVQVGDFISYGVCKFICLSSFMYNRFHKELRFFFSLLKRKKEAKKEKSSRSTCTTRSNITRRLYREFSTYVKSFIFMWKPLHRLTAVPLVLSGPLCPAGISPPRGESPLSGEAFLTFEFPPTKLPRRGEQAACPP